MKDANGLGSVPRFVEDLPSLAIVLRTPIRDSSYAVQDRLDRGQVKEALPIPVHDEKGSGTVVTTRSVHGKYAADERGTKRH